MTIRKYCGERLECDYKSGCPHLAMWVVSVQSLKRYVCTVHRDEIEHFVAKALESVPPLNIEREANPYGVMRRPRNLGRVWKSRPGGTL